MTSVTDSRFGKLSLPRSLSGGPDIEGVVVQDAAGNAGFRTWFAGLAATSKPTTQEALPDGSPAPMAIYVYVEGTDAIFVGADLIRGENVGGDTHESAATPFSNNPE